VERRAGCARGAAVEGARERGDRERRITGLIRSMGWRDRPVRFRAAAAWIPALAVLAVAGLWGSARAQAGIETSIDVDVTGAARIAFFDLFHGDLEFASRSGTTGSWTVQRVDTRGGRGLHPSLGDSAGGPAISYYDQENADLVYAKRDAGVWSTSIVDAAGDVGSASSLKFNPSNLPAIAYFDATNGDLKFASWTGSAWNIETVDAGGVVGSHCSLAFDFSGLPNIAYYDATNTALKLARKSGSSWIIETIPDAAGVGEYCALAVDGSQGPRISYFDAANGDLKFARKSGAVWSVVTVDAPGTVGRYTSLRFDTFHIARIAYYDDTNGDLKLATGTGSPPVWSLEVVADAGDVGRFASLALDVQGNPRVCGYDVNNGAIRYAAYLSTTGRWSLELADAQSRTGRFNSLAIDAQGVSHAGFFDVVHGRLAYGRRGVSGGWTFETPDASDQAGQYVSLALGAAGVPAMSYYDPTEGELRFASRAAGAWAVEVVDNGIAGMFSSLAFYNGIPRIAYFDARNEALKYATRGGAGWNLETVDIGPGVGLYASLAIDGAGNPSIAYFDALLGNLKVASKSGSTWTVEVVESAGNVGQYASLALGGGTTHVGYHDATAFSPRYAVKAGSSWLAEAVDTAGTGGLHTSLVLDGAGQPNIAYYNEPKSSLRYAVRTGGWTSPRETADNAGSVGRFISLVLDGAGNPRATYYDGTNHALQYAIRDPSGVWARENLDGEFPAIHVWSFTGAFEDQTHAFIGTDVCAGLLPPAPDSSRTQARTLTVRFLRDRRAESRPDFGGYRIYRVIQNADTSRMELIRRFSRQRGDFLGWYMSVVDTTDPTLPFKCGGVLAHDSIATFVDPDSNGHYEKFCPELLNNRCVKDSVWRLVAPPGPHDGIPTYYSVTIEGRNSGLEGTYEDLYVPGRDPDTRNNYELCTTAGDPATCPRVNLNNKSANVTPSPGNPRLEPTGGPVPDLEQVLVVPNPYRAAEVWDQPGAHEVHFINLPQKATIKVFTVAGDLVVQLEHNDPVRDFEPWNLRNGKGTDVASGIYIYRIESPKCDTCVPPMVVPFSMQNRMVVIR
jgi:hypothetical protein